jgi:anthranilate phosphoribosyltransferase
VSAYASLLRALISRHDLDRDTIAGAIGAIMDADWTSAQAGAFLAALATKGETAEEVLGAALAFRERALHVEHALPIVADTCGTGGDGAQTINISTAVAFVVAACGIPVAKHGNRSASSKCGSADVLEASGIDIQAGPDDARRSLEQHGFAFLYAQTYHPAMRAVGPVRRELGVRTVFNVLGPLANPARASHQVIGVAVPHHLELVGGALQALGAERGAVVHARSGVDEVVGDAPTDVYQIAPSGVRRWTLEPSEFGIRASADDIRGGDVAFNLAALRAILEGERSPRADVVALNAALAFVVFERAASLAEGLALARATLARGAAAALFTELQHPRFRFAPPRTTPAEIA